MASITINFEGEKAKLIAAVVAQFLADQSELFFEHIADKSEFALPGETVPEECHAIISGGRHKPHHEITYTF